MSSIAVAQTPAQVEQQVDKLLRKGVADLQKTPGILIGVVTPDTVFTLSYGTVERGKALPPSPDDVFEIGGLTHLFVALLAHRLEEEGRLRLEDSPNRYLPDSVQNPAAERIHLRDLLTHTASLPRLPLDFTARTEGAEQPFVAYTNDHLLRYYQRYPFEEDRLGAYIYSPLSYALLQPVLERAGDAPLAGLLRTYIASPLDLPATAIVENHTGRVQGYRANGDPAPYYRFDSFASAGGLSSSMNDLLRFAQLQMDQNGSAFRAIFRQTQTARIPTGYARHAYAAEGWHAIIPRKRFYPILLQSGSTGGFHADIAMVPITGRAVVVLGNANQSLSALAFEVLRFLNGNWRKQKVDLP